MTISKKLPKSKIYQYFVCDIAKGLFNGMIGNYLLYVYQPTAKSGLPSLLPDNKLFGFITIMAILTGISKVIDAITDPMVANYSDRCKNKNGRRIPFLRIAAIPYAVFVLMIFLAPFREGSFANAVWVGFFLIAYYVAYTVYYIPHKALVPEIIPDPKERVGYYAVSTIFFMGSSAVMYTTTMFVNLFKKAGLEPLMAWRTVFIIFSVIGLACLLCSAFAFRERDYIEHSNNVQENIWKSFGIVLRNKNFVKFSLGDLFSYISMAFFQSAMLYYITVLLKIPEAQSYIVMIVAIACAIAFFPLITMISRRFNKKTPLIVASWMFVVLFALIYFGDDIANLLPGREIIIGIIMGVCVSFPFATINIIPQAILSDIIQEDSLRSGVNREGIYSATKTFIEKIASAVALIVVSSLLAIGAVGDEKVGLYGVKLTGIFAGVFSLISAICFIFYNDKSIIKFIKEKRNDIVIDVLGNQNREEVVDGLICEEIAAGVDTNDVSSICMSEEINNNEVQIGKALDNTTNERAVETDLDINNDTNEDKRGDTK